MSFKPVFAPEITFQIRALVTDPDHRVLENPRGFDLAFDETAEFHGKGLHWSADELFLSSILVSLANTFLYHVRRRKGRFEFTQLELGGELTVLYDETTRTYVVGAVKVEALLRVPLGQKQQASRIWTRTTETCHILRSIAPTIAKSVEIRIIEV